MRGKRTRHPNYTPAVCMGVCALLLVWALGLLLQRCSAPFRCDGGWYLANGSFYTPYCNLHCVVVLAQGEEGCLTANPLTGWQWVDEDQFWSAFDAMGRRAVTLCNE